MTNLEDIKFDDYVKILRRRKWVLVIFLVVGPIIGYVTSLLLPKRYLSKSLVLIEQQQIPKDYVQSVVPGKLDQQVVQIMETVLGEKYLQAMIERLGLAQRQSPESSEALAAELSNTVKVKPMAGPLDNADGGGLASSMPSGVPSEDLTGFYINVTYRDPSVAQKLCTEITSAFIEENLRLHEQSSVSTTDFLQKQADEAKRKLDEQDRELAAFKSKYIGELPENEQINLNRIEALTAQLDFIIQALDGAQQSKSYTESLLAQQVDNWRAEQKTQQSLNSPETIEAELAKQQIILADREARYTPSHPDVIAARKDLEELKKRVEEAKSSASSEPNEGNKSSAKKSTEMEPAQIVQLRSQLNELEQTVKEKTQEQQQLEEEIKRYQQRIEGSPAIEQEYKDLTRDHESALKLYNDLLAKRSESAMAGDMERHQEGERFRVMEPANLPTSPSFPNPLLFTGGGFGGSLILGICVALILETSDHTLRTERDVEVFLNVPVLAQVPAIAGANMKKRLREPKASSGARMQLPNI
jgi:polysaccharide chain length determinant protein (PEP-CTERM system associated)